MFQKEVDPSIAELTNYLGTGQHKKKCPKCQHLRNRNRNDRSLSVNIDSTGVRFHCHHCDVQGGWLHNDNSRGRFMDFAPPTARPILIEDVTNAGNEVARNYLKSRGITEPIIDEFTLQDTYTFNGNAVPAVGFPYRNGEDVHAVKWRSADDSKQFSQQNVCSELYNLHSYTDGDTILICEGEMDALSWMSCNLPEDITVVSIPNGAPPKVRDGKIDPNEDKKFRYVYEAKKFHDSSSKIILNTDNDSAGKALREELIRRLGRAKVYTIDLGEYKDASEALLAEGSPYLIGRFDEMTPLPMVGLHDIGDFTEQVMDLYTNGQLKGASTGINSLDQLIQVPLGMVTIVTGFPSSGKSDLIDQICVNLAQNYGWKTVYCSFEKPAELHAAQLAQKKINMPFFEGPTPRMSDGQLEFAMEWIKDNFLFMDYRRGGPTTIDGILEVASAAVMRMGCRVLVIDPYNYIGLDPTERETDAISKMLTKVQQWAKSHDCHVFFIAHPTKMAPDRRSDKKVVCTGHDIAGAAAWFAKADIGLTCWRHPTDQTPPEAHVWKVRWSWIGRHGPCPLSYDKATGRWGDRIPVGDDYDWEFLWD